MIAGLILSDSETEDSFLCFMGETTETFSIKETEELLDTIEKKEPEVLTADCGTELNSGELTENEENLKEEGYSFTPSYTEKKRVERLRAIDRSLKHRMEKPPELIRFDPAISSEELALHGDSSLESLGIDTSDIDSSREFDATVGAVTARFYSQNHYRDEGLIVPERIDEQKT